ncbi:MAG: adenine deaminase [Deltaproteobacteria bacterium]|jgi:adenine deaminase|nr:adenine deaminase [Deltaproteobacteria bacterium]
MQSMTPLNDITRLLSAVAMGRKKADMVIKNGNLINVNTLEIISGVDVAIKADRIALVGSADHCLGGETEVIDATAKYITPGFMDGHIHVESSFLTVSQYSHSVVPHGTSAIFMDPHEIANVLGMRGVDLMVDESKALPLRVYTTLPSCVPAAPGLEDTGAEITAKEIAKQIKQEAFIGLGEMMNFPGVIQSDEQVHQAITSTLKAGKCVTGHFSIPETGKMLNAYIGAGLRSCHETVRYEDAIAKMRLGMYVKIREGSAWHDLKEVIKSITQHKISSRFAILVSDDSHPETLIKNGHMDYIVRRAIEEGVSPVEAISMVTLNVAECFYLTPDFGSVSPGKIADINILDDLETVKVDKVLISGKLVAEKGVLKEKPPLVSYPAWAKNTVKLKQPIIESDFDIKSDLARVRVNAIQIEEAKVGTKCKIVELETQNGCVMANIEKNIAKVAVFERHHLTGSRAVGFVKGFRFKRGAVASTYAHDAHNLLIVGTNDTDMAMAGNSLAKIGGGMMAVNEGEVVAQVELPIAGLMSDQSAEIVQAAIQQLEKAWEILGCDLVSPFMTMALMALPVIPDIRITNRGLFDVNTFQFIDTILGNSKNDL